MAFNENTRVKIPAILHLTRLGYKYVSLKDANWDKDTNIFTEIFTKSINRINSNEKSLKLSVQDSDDFYPPDTNYDGMVAESTHHAKTNRSKKAIDFQKLVDNLKELLDYDDLGRAFYNRLISDSGTKLIDFSNFKNNSFHVCTELPCKNGDDEFRPDITILVNGIPLIFIEVKKPNNKDGILAERNRINMRFQNKKFKRFINATQLMIFSNNMEYDDESIVPIQGAFYATISATEAVFNCFREEDEEIFNKICPVNDEVEDSILLDNNLAAIKNSSEYISNKEPTKPTNRIISSLLNLERLKFILKYGLVYVEAAEGLSKHIMRYPQIFATKAIEKAIDSGTRKGIIWHTQGSGKTALAFFNVVYLISFFQKKKIVPKFYFIVDRIDLMTQARDEFSNRGLHVITVNDKVEFKNNIKAVGAIKNTDGKNEITVVNIQKFSEDSRVATQSDYNINTQRIYFLDEVHRSYNPHGSFLAIFFSSDKNAIYIGLTGTPLLNKKLKPVDGGKSIEYNSKDIFGDYIHKYYYDLSIKDGYTLKLIREGIETTYKTQLKEILDKIELLHGSANKRIVYAHDNYVNPLADYINLFNLALEEIIFRFVKVSEKELQLGVVDEFKKQVQKTREAMQDNFDHQEAVYISLYKELERIFKKKKLSEMSTEDISENIILLKSIYDQITEQNRRDNLLKAKYKNDAKFARIYKWLKEMLRGFVTPLFCSNFCKVISLKDRKYFYYFMFIWKQLYDNGLFFGYEGKISGIETFLFDDFVNYYKIAVPSTLILNKFNKTVSPIFSIIIKSQQGNTYLAKLHDFLIPLLMNG